MTQAQINFINIIGNASLQYYQEYLILPSLTIAQAIKESRWGESKLSTECFNYFGMKWTTDCGCNYKEYSTKEWDKNKQTYITIKAKFRKYSCPAEGIKGYYNFLNYKRYKNLRGVTDSASACMLIQKDGWATSPTYGTSLYKDYVIPYNLLDWDAKALGLPILAKNLYELGKTYTLQANMYVRIEPKGEKLNFEDLTINAKEHAKDDGTGKAILYKGTRVTCQGVLELNDAIWIKIPSGYVCAKTNEKVYIL